MLFFLFYNQLIILFFTYSPKILIGLNEDILLEGFETFTHLWVDLETDTRDDFAQTVGFAKFWEFGLNLRISLEIGFELDEDLLREVTIMKDFSDLVFLGRVQLINLNSS